MDFLLYNYIQDLVFFGRPLATFSVFSQDFLTVYEDSIGSIFQPFNALNELNLAR